MTGPCLCGARFVTAEMFSLSLYFVLQDWCIQHQAIKFIQWCSFELVRSLNLVELHRFVDFFGDRFWNDKLKTQTFAIPTARA